MVRDTPNMTKDYIIGESNGSLVSEVSWQMTKWIGLLKLGGPGLPAMISHLLGLVIMTGVGTASVDGEGVWCRNVGEVADVHL